MTPRAALALALVAVSVACRGDPGPADTYRAFAAAARAGDAARVWSTLSERSRAVLDERARAVAATVPEGVVAASGRQLALGDLAAAAPPPKSVTVVRESRDAAVVSVEVEGAPAREVSLVREGGLWRVVVPFDN